MMAKTKKWNCFMGPQVAGATSSFRKAMNSLQTENMPRPCFSAWVASVGPVPTGGSQDFPEHKHVCRCHQVTYPAAQLTDGTMYSGY